VAGALGIVLELLANPGAGHTGTAELLNVFQEARAADAQISALAGHTDRVRWAAFSGDGRRVITASDDRTARIWDTATGLQIRLLSHNDHVNSAAFSPGW
jgi:WD40 repeat protein